MSNALRLPGLATGMDTDSTIKQLMKPYNMKVDKMKQEKQAMQWKQEITRDMIKELRELKNSYLNVDSKEATNMVKASTFSVANITSSNGNILTATAMPGATSIPTNISVEEVAKPASLLAKFKTANPNLSTSMGKLGFNDGEEIVLKYGKVPKEEVFSVKVSQDDTLQTFINKFNSSKSNGDGAALYEKVQISFSELTNSLNIETRDTGIDEVLSISTNPDTDLQSRFDIKNKEVSGNQAKVNIIAKDGSLVEVKRPKNEFVIDNVCYSINSGYVVDSSTKNIVLTSKPDGQKSVDKIKGFVDKYNEIVDKIYSKYTQKKQYKFNPLTDEQKKEMKEDEIKRWEVKAKEGLISGDEAIGSLLNSMRTAIFTPVEGAGISLREIGLDSFSGIESTTKPGQIKLDADKLKRALETRGDQVMKLFSQIPDPSITDKEKINSNTGVFTRLQDVLNNYVGKFDAILLKRVGIEGTISDIKNDLTDKLKKKDTLIAQMEKKMATQEERYYQKFARLEKAMNMFNSQSSWLTSQLGGGK